ncbi:MAG: hypothetical protein JNL98_35165 [Bryobacterales bacterium]|nr:hypothetical protein [Bryobacterales bacterium]
MIRILMLLILFFHAAMAQDTADAGTLQGFLTGTASAVRHTGTQGRQQFPSLWPGPYQLNAVGLSVSVGVRARLSSDIQISLAQFATRRDKVEVTVLLAAEESMTPNIWLGRQDFSGVSPGR